MTEKIGYLFGAGAEEDFGIRSGMEFARGLLKKDEQIHKAVQEHYAGRLKHLEEIKKTWYPDKFQTSSFAEKTLLEKAVMKMKYEGLKKGLVPFIDRSENRFQEKAREHGYLVELPGGGKQTELTEKGWELVVRYPNYMGVLDERFHTLIHPRSFGVYRFWSVLAIYTYAYLIIARDILRESRAPYNTYEGILNDPAGTCREILRTIEEEERYKKDSYYSVLKEAVREEAKVITTNYTPILEKVAGIDHSWIAYIHGKLSLFESAYRLQVYDVADKNFQEHFKKDILFPYIFIQSGIKPVVEQRQLEEYARTLDILKSIDELVILGYKINYDDNHLNSLLGSFALGGKGITYFAYDDPDCSRDDICGKLRLRGKNNIKIEVIHIGKKDGVGRFREYLQMKLGN